MARKKRRAGADGPSAQNDPALAVLTPERRQHDRIELMPKTDLDSNGEIFQGWKTQDICDRLLSRGDIGFSEYEGGKKFREIYRAAALHPLRAADYEREVRHQMTDTHYGGDRARKKRDDAIRALGGHDTAAGRCAWFVLGEEMSLREWALRDGWIGRPLREEAAKGILVGTLGALAGHFGY